MIKKIMMTLAAILVLAAAGLGGFAWHIYKKDFGVPYKGRARLDYNWKYHFAFLPKESLKFEGKYFSFMYPKFKKGSEFLAIKNGEDGFLVEGRNLLVVFWNKTDPAVIKSELSAQLKADKPIAPSLEFLKWLNPESYKLRETKAEDYPKFYNVEIEKINLKLGGEALRVSLWSKVQERPHMRFIIGLTPGGQVFKTETLVRYNASEELYGELVFPGHWMERTIPDAERDAQSAYFLEKFIETVEFKK